MNKLMSNLFLVFLMVFSVGVRAETSEKTEDAYDVGASMVESVYHLKHKTSSGSVDVLRVLVLDNGAHANPLGTLLISHPGPEGLEEQSLLHKVALGMTEVKSVQAKWNSAENSSAGGLITVNGYRYNVVSNKAEKMAVYIKYTDATNVYLDKFEVSRVP